MQAKKASEAQASMVANEDSCSETWSCLSRRWQTDKETNARTARLDSVQHTAMFSY